MYSKVGGHTLRLDLYLPLNVFPPHATVLYIHGGGWHQGSKIPCPAPSLVSDGFAVACTNYRLSGVAPFPAQLHDVRAAVRFLRQQSARYKLDSKKVGAWGLSAGAHLASMLGVAADVKALRQSPTNIPASHRVQAVAAWFPPTDFLSVDYGYFKQYGDAVRRLLRVPHLDSLKDEPAQARLASPMSHVSKDDAPHLLMHGRKDRVVPFQQSRELSLALKRAGGKVTYREIPNAGHGDGFGESHEVEVRDFFREHLRGGKPPSLKSSDKPAF